MSEPTRPSDHPEPPYVSIVTEAQRDGASLTRRQFLGFGAAGLASAALVSSPPMRKILPRIKSEA